jgi:hypothetical protein
VKEQIAEPHYTLERDISAPDDNQKLRWAIVVVPRIRLYRYQLSSRQRGSALRDLPDTMRRKLAECTVNVMMLPDMVGVGRFARAHLTRLIPLSLCARRTAGRG